MVQGGDLSYRCDKGIAAILVFLLCFLILWAIDKTLIRKMNQKLQKQPSLHLSA